MCRAPRRDLRRCRLESNQRRTPPPEESPARAAGDQLRRRAGTRFDDLWHEPAPPILSLYSCLVPPRLRGRGHSNAATNLRLRGRTEGFLGNYLVPDDANSRATGLRVPPVQAARKFVRLARVPRSSFALRKAIARFYGCRGARQVPRVERTFHCRDPLSWLQPPVLRQKPVHIRYPCNSGTVQQRGSDKGLRSLRREEQPQGHSARDGAFECS